MDFGFTLNRQKCLRGASAQPPAPPGLYLGFIYKHRAGLTVSHHSAIEYTSSVEQAFVEAVATSL